MIKTQEERIKMKQQKIPNPIRTKQDSFIGYHSYLYKLLLLGPRNRERYPYRGKFQPLVYTIRNNRSCNRHHPSDPGQRNRMELERISRRCSLCIHTLGNCNVNCGNYLRCNIDTQLLYTD